MLQPSYSSDSSDNEDDYLEEEETEEEKFLCLFCDMVLSSSGHLMDHSLKAHKLNLVSAFSETSFYGTIKVINYTRGNKCSVEEFSTVLKRSESLEDEYLKPCLNDDSLLMIDFEELSHAQSQSCAANGKEKNANGESNNGKVEFLQAKLEQMQQAYMDLLEKTDKSNAQLRPATDSHYFESYADYTIHAEMLQDKVRTEAYRDYIYKNKDIFSDKDVLDVGCGTGILSMFCAQGGARSVMAVDNSKIVDKARSVIRSNNLSSKIEVVKGKVEEIEVDKKFDILISEWMGYGLLFECMLDSVITARDKYLKPDGLVVPNRASMFVSAVSDEVSYQHRFHFWNDVYGFKMNDVVPDLYKEAVVECVDKDNVISDNCGFKHLDLQTVKTPELEFSRPFQLQISSSSKLTALVVHFTCFFDGDVSIVLDTSPESETTHWLQTILYLKCPTDVLEGDVVHGLIAFNKDSTVKRGYVIKIEGAISRDSAVVGKFNQLYHLH
ncbi:uncharacterized protein LOC134817655 [Bolinopsis microptera]|uniref:uncharacterized protein LOC134817655 n=1 Tax=Bolinopsis microptera TaxID=2820187 RepID=UPI00307B008F